MAGKLNNRGNDKAVIELDRYTIQDKVTINAFHVRARHHHAMFIGAKNDVIGVGYRAGGRGEGYGFHKIIERPEEC